MMTCDNWEFCHFSIIIIFCLLVQKYNCIVSKYHEWPDSVPSGQLFNVTDSHKLPKYDISSTTDVLISSQNATKYRPRPCWRKLQRFFGPSALLGKVQSSVPRPGPISRCCPCYARRRHCTRSSQRCKFMQRVVIKRIRYLSKKIANFNEFSEIKNIRKNSYKNSLNAWVGVVFQWNSLLI